jgi:hypothetical protein
MAISTGSLMATQKTAQAQDLLDVKAQGLVITGGLYQTLDAPTPTLSYGLDSENLFEFASKADVLAATPTPLAFNDSGTVDFQVNGNQISAATKKSAQPDNALVLNADGLYVAPAPAQTPDYILSVGTTATTVLTRSATGLLKADVKVTDPNDTANGKNGLKIYNDGLFVPAPFAGLSNSIEHEYVEEDDLMFHNIEVKVATGTDNAVTVVTGLGGGVKVKKLTVAATSLGLLSINANNEINIEKAATVEVVVSTQVSLAAFIANDPKALLMASGDYVYLPNATDKKQGGFIHNGASGTLGTSSFVPVEFPDYTDAQIRALFSAVNGVEYNPSTGVFSSKISANPANDLTLDSVDGGLFVDVAVSPISVTSKGITSTKTVQQAITELFNQPGYDAENGLTSRFDTALQATIFELGGNLTKNTTIVGATHGINFDDVAGFTVNSLYNQPIVFNSVDGNNSFTLTNSGGDDYAIFSTEIQAPMISISNNAMIGGDIVLNATSSKLTMYSDNGSVFYFGVNNSGQLYNLGAGLR